MVTLKKSIQLNYSKLKKDGFVSFGFNDAAITATLLSEGSKLLLSAPVFEGHGYIPEQVRQAVEKPLHWQPSSIPTSLRLEDKRSEVRLQYIGKAEQSLASFQKIVEEFVLLAHEWRAFFDDRGGKDLIFVRRTP